MRKRGSLKVLVLEMQWRKISVSVMVAVLVQLWTSTAAKLNLNEE